jgi:alkylation response protein AidB-like acyl-CoA dehydrogenase
MNITDEKELALLGKISREFARKALLPDRTENDDYPYGKFWIEPLEKAFELGFFHTLLPETLEGLGRRLAPFCTVLQSICETDAAMGAILFTNAFAQEILLIAGADESLASIVKTNDGAISFLTGFQVFANPSETQTRLNAIKTNQGYRLSGTAEYVVLGGLARRCLVAASVNGGPSCSYFLVNPEGGPVHRSDPILSLGLHACPAVDMIFEGAEGRLVGQADKGGLYFSKACDRLFSAMAAMSLGIMKGSFKAAIDYSRKRIQGGKKIIEWTEVQMMLANMAFRLKTAEVMTEQAFRTVDEKTPGWEQTGEAAALYLQELASEFTSDGIQILGGYGYIKEYGQEKYFRDAKQLQALAGIFPMKKIRYLKRYFPP